MFVVTNMAQTLSVDYMEDVDSEEKEQGNESIGEFRILYYPSGAIDALMDWWDNMPLRCFDHPSQLT